MLSTTVSAEWNAIISGNPLEALQATLPALEGSCDYAERVTDDALELYEAAGVGVPFTPRIATVPVPLSEGRTVFTVNLGEGCLFREQKVRLRLHSNGKCIAETAVCIPSRMLRGYQKTQRMLGMNELGKGAVEYGPGKGPVKRDLLKTMPNQSPATLAYSPLTIRFDVQPTSVMCEFQQYVAAPKGLISKNTDDMRNVGETFVIDFASVLDGQAANYASVELERSPKADGGHVHPGAAKMPGRRFATVGCFRRVAGGDGCGSARGSKCGDSTFLGDGRCGTGAFGHGGSYNNFDQIPVPSPRPSSSEPFPYPYEDRSNYPVPYHAHYGTANEMSRPIVN